MAESNRSTQQLISSALEMATEIKERNGQYYSLASAIEDGLAPPSPGADPVDWNCYSLVRLLSELLADNSQLWRLVKCLETAHEKEAEAQPA